MPVELFLSWYFPLFRLCVLLIEIWGRSVWSVFLSNFLLDWLGLCFDKAVRPCRGFSQGKANTTKYNHNTTMHTVPNTNASPISSSWPGFLFWQGGETSSGWVLPRGKAGDSHIQAPMPILHQQIRTGFSLEKLLDTSLMFSHRRSWNFTAWKVSGLDISPYLRPPSSDPTPYWTKSSETKPTIKQ